MQIEELNKVLESSEDGEWIISKTYSEFNIKDIDEIKTYIFALNQRLVRVADVVLWPILLLWAVILIIANTELLAGVPYIHELSGWLAGSLLFIVAFSIYTIISRSIINKHALSFKIEFTEKSRKFNFTRDEIITADWVDSKGSDVKVQLINGTFETYR